MGAIPEQCTDPAGGSSGDSELASYSVYPRDSPFLRVLGEGGDLPLARISIEYDLYLRMRLDRSYSDKLI